MPPTAHGSPASSAGSRATARCACACPTARCARCMRATSRKGESEMLLAVDVGNTNVVFALFEGRAIRTRWRIATDPRRTGDEYAVWLLQLLAVEGLGRETVTGMIVSTVVPRARHNLEVLGQKYFGLEPLFAGEG